MAAKRTAVPDIWWDDIDNVKQPPAAHAIFFYLACGGTRNLSGVYIKSLDEIAFKSNVPLEEVFQLVGGNNIRRVRYDEETRTVFVMDRFRWNLIYGGNPEKNASSIMADHDSTVRASSLWRMWQVEYDAYVNGGNLDAKVYPANPWLQAHFAGRIPEGVEPKIVPVKSAIEGGKIPGMLLRYAELGPTEYECVLAAYDLASRNSKTGEPLAEATRVSLLEGMEKHETLVVATACSRWKERGGRGGNRPTMLLTEIATLSRQQKERAK